MPVANDQVVLGRPDQGRLEETSRVLERIVAERKVGTGIQLSVGSRDFRVDYVAGETLGGDMAVGHLHNVYCAAKPLISLAIGHLIDGHHLELDRPVQDILGPQHGLLPPWTLTASSILCHSAGLGAPNAMTWRITPTEARMGLIDFDGRSCVNEYSELLGGLILEALIEKATGQSASSFVMDRVVRPLGLQNEIIFDVRSRAREVLPRVRVPFGGLPSEAIPLLSERIPSQVVDLQPAFGGLATMAALCTLYNALGQLYFGKEHPALPACATFKRMLSRRRGWGYDPVMRREIDFAGGFMCDLGGGGMYDDVGPDSFGHNGGFVTTIAFFDPAMELSFALYINGIVDAESARVDRKKVVASVYSDLRNAGCR